ncbi:protein brunelleschi [Chrysoperla carnea]|uniref:protein brunelleschi n=1 Tax=Chrysoperla carnea TaxID=189513 RepID=UPI001D093DB8|nr:protein brunelleschi [Chrysoperla carnea]
MRSSVSYILSSAASEPNMSYPDYEQISHDHAAVLILVRQIGTQLKTKTFSRLFERILRCNCHKITDSSGQVREVWIRYVKEYPVENNDWGDFQTHRKLLGLISLGKYDSQQELNEICRVHESLKVKYTSTLFDTRCILFGPSEPPGLTDGEKLEKDIDNLNEEEKKTFQTPSNFKTRAFFYNDGDPCVELETHLSEFVNSLFWVLESKRLERSREKIERVSLLLAPFEKKDFVGLDLESRNNKKRCMGRITKHLGDLSLQAGLISESLTFYYSARDTLKSVNDWLWLGAAYEGLCAASVLVLYPNFQRSVPLQRNSSLQDGSPGKSRSNSVVSIPSTELIRVRKDITNILSEDDISKKYREAIIHYSKYQNAGIIETEASFKAARISIEQNQTLQAASFLQNVVFINLTLSEQEKIQRFETLSDLYTQIGFVRKASFCQRLGASRYVSQNNPSPNWSQCYNLMLQSFSGYKLSLEPNEMLANQSYGWQTLQIQLLQEIVVAARRMGHGALATRHMTFLLQTMWNHLTPQEQRDLSLQLQGLSSQCEGAPVPLVLDSGIVIPPANLTNIPKCKMFKIQNLKPHLQPQKIEKEKLDHGPFLFTPIHFGGSLDRKNKKPKSKMDFLWVENDICEVQLTLINPLPFELKVSNMRLLTNGPVFESIPETILLPPETPQLTTLIGTPKECGELEILGYSTHSLGVKSNCRLKNMEKFLPLYSIDIIPALPVMDIKTSLPQSATFSNFSNYENIVTSASLSLYNGESAECTITLTNTSDVIIELLDVSIQSGLEPSVQDQIFKWSQSNLESQLPLASKATASLTLYLYSATNFLGPVQYLSVGELSSGIYCNSSHPSSLMSMSVGGPSSLPSRINSPVHGSAMMGSSFHSARRNEFMSSSFRSSNSGQSSLATTMGGARSPLPSGLTCVPINTVSSTIEAQLRLRYSGGSGYQTGYCRTSSVYISLEMLPSVQITSWDVIPAETNSHFYLVLDITNLTSQEMELHYTPTKHILIEGHKCCSVAVPLNRCPLSKLSKIYMDQQQSTVNNLELNKICSEHIANSVDLRWHLLGTDTKGKVSLKGITLTPNMLDLVRMSPLNWNVTLNSQITKSQEEICFNIGESITLGIQISNNLERPLRQLTLDIQFYQDHQNGINNYRLDTRLATIGATKVLLPTLEEQGQTYHECIVIFFTPGQYKADIQCTAPENLNGSIDTNIGGAIVDGQQSGHTWRYIPPVEIRINE